MGLQLLIHIVVGLVGKIKIIALWTKNDRLVDQCLLVEDAFIEAGWKL